MRVICFIMFYFTVLYSYSQESALFGCWQLDKSEFDINIRNEKYSRVAQDDYVRIRLKRGKDSLLIIRRGHSFFDREKYIFKILRLDDKKMILRYQSDIGLFEFIPTLCDTYIFYKVECSELDVP